MILSYKNYKVIYGKVFRSKPPFIEIQDYSGKIQVYSKKKFKLGDIIVIYGKIKKTKKQIIYIFSFYVKLIVNNLKFVKNNFFLKKIFCIYNFFFNYFKKFMFIFLNSTNFCKTKSTSNSNIFKTYSFCKKKFFYLKISPEFHIKKILSNNYNRIFDITKCYRNEGCSNIHFFEFNMIEYYSSDINFKNSIFFLEKLIKNLFLIMSKFFIEIYNLFFLNYLFFKKKILLELILIFFVKRKIFFKKKNFFLYCLFKEILNIKNFSLSNIIFKIFDEKIKKKKYFPFFLIFFPRKNSPLTRIFNLNLNFLKRFELYISNVEIANGFEELNDYYIQKKNLSKKNKDFLVKIKNCLNYITGVGIGIDRLSMIILKCKQIKKILK